MAGSKEWSARYPKRFDAPPLGKCCRQSHQPPPAGPEEKMISELSAVQVSAPITWLPNVTWIGSPLGFPSRDNGSTKTSFAYAFLCRTNANFRPSGENAGLLSLTDAGARAMSLCFVPSSGEI